MFVNKQISQKPNGVLRWLVELKLIQLEQQKTTSSQRFSKNFKTNILQSYKRYMKIFELEINNLRIKILAAKMM